MNFDNESLIEDCFRDASITDRISKSTDMKYRDSIKKFFSVTCKRIDELELKDFENFILKMKDGGASNSRIANVISAVKWLISYLQENNMIQKKLDLEKIKKPKIDRREVEYLTDQEIAAFICAIEKDYSKGPDIRKTRFLALAYFLLQTGARIGEALSINTEDIDRINMEVRIVGKGKKPRTLFLVQKTVDVLDQYLLSRNDEHEALFVALNGKSRWKQTDVGRSFRRYKNLSGIKKKFTIHTLRHTFATKHLLSGTPINTVQFFLGHSNLETTMKYYIGAVENTQARKFVKDEYFDFMS